LAEINITIDEYMMLLHSIINCILIVFEIKHIISHSIIYILLFIVNIIELINIKIDRLHIIIGAAINIIEHRYINIFLSPQFNSLF